MTTDAPQAAERRLIALTATLIQRGALPALYRTPPKQTKLARQLQRTLGSLLGGAGSGLLSGLDSGAISPADLVQVDGALALDSEVLLNGLQETYQSTYLEAAQAAFERQARTILGRSGVDVTWDLVEPRAVEVLREVSFTASRSLVERVTGDVRGVLVQGFEGGLGTREIGRNLRSAIDDISSRQAEGIARTEVNSAANRGNFLAMEEAQVEYVQWIAAQDSRTRPSHVAHHGLVVRRGERFPNGLRHPGDRDGAVGEWVACRCAGAAYFPLRSELGQATPFVGRA